METGDRRYKNLDEFFGRVSTKDPEFAAKVRSKIGAPYEYLVDPSQAQNIGDPNTPYGLLGANIAHYRDPTKPGSVGATTTVQERQQEADRTGLASLGADPRKSVFGLGAGAAPSTFSHEFRHNVEKNESQNRLQDLLHSPTPEDYVKNIQFMYQTFTNSYGAKVPFAEKEKMILEEFLNREQYDLFKRHSAINNYDTSTIQEFQAHPIDVITGNRKVGSHGNLTQGTYKERVQYPFLNFVGAPDNPDYMNTSTGRDKVAREEINDALDAANKKATGGPINMPNNYRAGGRVRAI